jgi:hypothetical protein
MKCLIAATKNKVRSMGEDLLCGLYLVYVIGWQIVPPSILGHAKGLPNTP